MRKTGSNRSSVFDISSRIDRPTVRVFVSRQTDGTYPDCLDGLAGLDKVRNILKVEGITVELDK